MMAFVPLCRAHSKQGMRLIKFGSSRTAKWRRSYRDISNRAWMKNWWIRLHNLSMLEDDVSYLLRFICSFSVYFWGILPWTLSHFFYSRFVRTFFHELQGLVHGPRFRYTESRCLRLISFVRRPQGRARRERILRSARFILSTNISRFLRFFVFVLKIELKTCVVIVNPF